MVSRGVARLQFSGVFHHLTVATRSTKLRADPWRHLYTRTAYLNAIRSGAFSQLQPVKLAQERSDVLEL